MFDFLIKKLDNFKFSTSELLAYYSQVENNFNDLRWHAKGTLVDNEEHSVSKLSGWAVQSNHKEPQGALCPYDIVVLRDSELIDESSNYQNHTKLVFGFAEKIINAVPYANMMSIACHPPSTMLKEHVDYDIFLKVHLPIKFNPKSYFMLGEEKFVLKVGEAYLINTTIPHSTNNMGDTERTHLIFRIPVEQVEHFLATEINI